MNFNTNSIEANTIPIVANVFFLELVAPLKPIIDSVKPTIDTNPYKSRNQEIILTIKPAMQKLFF